MASKPTIQTVTSQAQNNAFQVNKATDQLADAIVPLLPKDGSEALTGNLSLNGYRITDSGTPVNDADITPKSYVDDLTGNVSGYAAAAAASASEAESSALSAASSASSASSSASAASDSASASATSASTSSTHADTAAIYSASASDSADDAATSETNASNSASAAATSESNAATSASTATTQASNAATSASNASTSETNAANSASAASTSASEAATSAANAALYDPAWGSWVTLGPGANFIAYTQDLKYRVSADSKNIQFHGNLQAGVVIPAGAWAYGVFADLPVSVRPSNYRYATSINITTGEIYAIMIESDGRSRIYPPAGLTSDLIGFDFIINLDQ